MTKKNLQTVIKKQWRKLSSTLRRRIITIFTLLILYNILIWVLGFYVSFFHPLLLGLLAIAYGLGLRHAVDADHIAAIDNTTRKMLAGKQKPILIGFYFSLGHSTIVIILSLLVTLASTFIQKYFSSFQSFGAIIGTLISSSFLFLIGFLNLITVIMLFRNYKQMHQEKKYTKVSTMQIKGLFANIFKPFFRIINKSWQMYFVGLLFGLGFDTATEIGLLSISAINGLSTNSPWTIVLIPLAFTAGMTLIDTADGVLMLFAYGWAYVKPEKKFFYNVTITLLSVIVALVIGGVQLFGVFHSF